MEDGRIQDDQITAISSKDDNHDHLQARLESDSYWKPDGNDEANSWIQVEFPTAFTITKIQTQGDGGNKWVTKLKIGYATDTEAGSNQFIMDEEGDEQMVRHFTRKKF